MRMTTIISGIPVDSSENRELARKQGIDPDKFRWPQPYLNSVGNSCQECGMGIWIGPETHRAMLGLIARGKEFQVLCLICCVVMSRGADSVRFIQLTDKKEGELS